MWTLLVCCDTRPSLSRGIRRSYYSRPGYARIEITPIAHPETPHVSELVIYVVYLGGAAASGVWVYRDAQKHGHGHPRSVAAGTAVLFPVGLLLYILSR